MKKFLSMILASAMILALLAGCGGSGNGNNSGNGGQNDGNQNSGSQNDGSQNTDNQDAGSAKQYDGVQLTMWSMWSSGEPQANVIEEAAAAFQEQTGATINIEFKGRDVSSILSASLEAGEKFDIFEDDYQRIGTVYDDYTLDLTDMAKAVDYDSYSYACLNNQAIEWAGCLNSIVEQPNVGGIFYDKAAFGAAGITAEPKTWTEFMDACEKLKTAGVGPLAQDSAYCDFAFYHTLVRYLGEDKIEELNLNGGWSGTAAEQAAQDIIDLRNAGYLAEGAPDEYPSSQNKIGFGQAAMVICASYVTAEVNLATGTEVSWGLMPYPSVDGGADNGAAFCGANSLAITKYSENPQAAFDFIIFLTTGEYGQKLADEAGQTPADTRNTAPANVNGSIEALLAADKPMSWCASLKANADLKDTIKSMCVELFEGKYASGADFCAALDGLY